MSTWVGQRTVGGLTFEMEQSEAALYKLIGMLPGSTMLHPGKEEEEDNDEDDNDRTELLFTI